MHRGGLALSTIYRPCDLCFVRGGQFTESEFVDVRIKIGDTIGLLDLCEPHHEQLLMPVLEAIADRKDDDLEVRRKSSRKRGPWLCKAPDCPQPILKHMDTFQQHTRRVHGLTPVDYRATYGEPELLTPEEAAQVVVEARCKVPGCGRIYSTAQGNRWPLGALNSHLRGRHGLKPDMTPIR